MRGAGVLASLVVVGFLADGARAGSAAGYSMEVLVDGLPAAELPHGGRTYIEAWRGREYAVRLTNHTGARVAAALAVDGLNSIDAKRTTSREAAKWILEPYASIVIEGWQTSGATARKFFFTTEARSYGAWLGKTEDLGVITAAFFRERPGCLPREFDTRRQKSAEGPAAQVAPRDENAATGIGREVDHRVRRVEFDEEDAPAAVVSLRYEYRDGLVKLGILPLFREDDPLARRERARGFEDTGWAPDPYRPRH
ncbi:MAG TPA: hypothetical protein VFV75_20460 [Candidatus Polarisedimenticolaceae bacterium]|nr:hypothetical protein [Candidatus Polarisedimenticolaceae bacterium]